MITTTALVGGLAGCQALVIASISHPCPSCPNPIRLCVTCCAGSCSPTTTVCPASGGRPLWRRWLPPSLMPARGSLASWPPDSLGSSRMMRSKVSCLCQVVPDVSHSPQHTHHIIDIQYVCNNSISNTICTLLPTTLQLHCCCIAHI